MTIRSNPASRNARRVIAASLAAAIGLALTAAPAFADQGWDHHDGWRHHERWEHHHRWHHRDDDGWRGGYVYGYAAPPPVYYQPPPAYYAPPPPVYYGPPSVSFGFNIPLNH